MMNVITNISGRNLEQQLIPWIIILKCLQNSLGWKEQLYQDGILERRIPFWLLVHRGLKNQVELTGQKKKLHIYNCKPINRRYQNKTHKVIWG